MKSTLMNRFLMMIALLVLGTATTKADESTYITSVINSTTLLTAEGDTVQLIGVRPWETEGMGEKDLQDYLEILVGGVRVRLTADPMMPNNGSRKLRYVSVGGTLVNQHLIAEGYADAITDASFTRIDSFVEAVNVARSERLGRWSAEDQYTGIEVGRIDREIGSMVADPEATADQMVSEILR